MNETVGNQLKPGTNIELNWQNLKLALSVLPRVFIVLPMNLICTIGSRFSIHGDRAFFETAEFPWVEKIEAGWETILRELDEVLGHREEIPNFQELSKAQGLLTRDDKWKTFILYIYGNKVEKNTVRCPQTTRLLSQIPGMQTAFFSIFAGGKQLPIHWGPYKGLLRYHLGLLVPQPPDSCGIWVNGITAHWEPGKSLVFDDTYKHYAWNHSEQDRVVLFVDFERPLPRLFGALNRAFIRLMGRSSFVQEVVKNIGK